MPKSIMESHDVLIRQFRARSSYLLSLSNINFTRECLTLLPQSLPFRSIPRHQLVEAFLRTEFGGAISEPLRYWTVKIQTRAPWEYAQDSKMEGPNDSHLLGIEETVVHDDRNDTENIFEEETAGVYPTLFWPTGQAALTSPSTPAHFLPPAR